MSSWRHKILSIAVIAASLTGCGQSDNADSYLRAAREAIAEGKFDSASLELNNVLQSRPGDTEARLLLARVALIAGRSAVAERQARAVIRLETTNEAAEQVLCDALFERGQFEQMLIQFAGATKPSMVSCLATAHLYRGQPIEARRLYDLVLLSNPDSLPAKIGLVGVQQAMGQIVEAEQSIARIVRDAPFSIEALRMQASLLADQGRLEEAFVTLTDAVGLPHNLDNYRQWLHASIARAEILWRRGERDAALDETRELAEAFTSHPLPKYLRALMAYEAGDFRMANEYLRNVLSILPNHRPSQQLSAAADLAQGRLGRAQIHLNAQTEDRPDDPVLIQLLSRIYLGMGNAFEAATTMKRIPEEKMDAWGFAHYARALALSGDLEAARDKMARALQLMPGDPNLQVAYTAMLLHNGQLSKSDEVMSNWPTNDATGQTRSVLRLLRFLRAGDLERAQAYAKRRRRENPNELIALLALAEAAERKGERTDAVSWLEMARERNEDAVEPRLLLADYARREGNTEKMREIAQEILTSMPFNGEALQLLGDASLAQGDIYAAIDTLREASRVTPSSSNTTLALVRAQLAAGDFWLARREIKTAVMSGSLPVDSVSAMIIEEHRRGNTEQAFALADDLAAMTNGRSMGIGILGDLHMLNGNFDEAAKAYRRAQLSGPDRMLAFKAASAAFSSGDKDAPADIQRWLAGQSDDQQMQRVETAFRRQTVAPL